MSERRVPPVPERLNRNVDGTNLTLSFKWDRWRGWKTLAGTLASLVVFALAVIYLLSVSATWFVFVPLSLFMPTALLWGAAGLIDVVNATTIQTDLELVNVTTGPLSRADKDVTIRVNSLARIFAHQVRAGTNQNGVIVNEVWTSTVDGEELRLVTGVRDRATATFIASDLTQHLEIEG